MFAGGEDQGFSASVFGGGADGAVEGEGFDENLFAVILFGGGGDEGGVDDEEIAFAADLKELDGAADEVGEGGLFVGGLGLVCESEILFGEEADDAGGAIVGSLGEF